MVAREGGGSCCDTATAVRDRHPGVTHPSHFAIGTIVEPMHRPRILLVACESQPPYGPASNTAAMFRELLPRLDISVVSAETEALLVADNVDGILVGGSFSSAYDDKEWIRKLEEFLRQQIKSTPILGICFGHQVLAKALGGTVQAQGESRTGRWKVELTEKGQELLNLSSSVDLLVSHGDAVTTAPPNAIALAQENHILAFANKEGKTSAITFQAHPEYTSSAGQSGAFPGCCRAMDQATAADRIEDAQQHQYHLKENSSHVLQRVCELLGWESCE